MKGTARKIFTAAAVCTAAVLACLAGFVALPAGTSSRYVEGEVYSGEVAGATEDAATDHGEHTDWVDLNATTTYSTPTSINDDDVTVCWEDGVCTISAVYAPEANPVSCKLYLSGDLDANIAIRGTAYSSGNTTVTMSNNTYINVDLCLNGYAITGDGSYGPTLWMGYDQNTEYYSYAVHCTLNLYDCGSGEGKHFYKLKENGIYDFSTASKEYNDGCVRGGLITGGCAPTNYLGAGVTIGKCAEMNMYGGTIAGNEVAGNNSTSNVVGGVGVYSGTLKMYGGSVEGNGVTGVVEGSRNGGGVFVHSYLSFSTATDSYFYMYGGEIKNNYTANYGGGVLLLNFNDTSVSSTKYHWHSEFEMYGGVISGNRADYDGGGVAVCDQGENGITNLVKVCGGTIRENSAGRYGGGMFLQGYAETEISGGTITGNRADIGGGGVYLTQYSNRIGTLTLSGDAYIYGNHGAGKINNLYLATTGYYVTLGPSFTEAALIGVTPVSFEAGAQITQTGTDGTLLSAAAPRFVPDDRSWGIEVNETSYCLALRLKS